MSLSKRQQQMLQAIHADGQCNVDALADRFGVSGMTVRRDLAALAEAGRVIRTHGGAAAADRVSFEFDFLQRRRANSAAKRAIAAEAAGRVEDGWTVMLDSGTTTLYLAEALRKKDGLRVVTTSLPIASALQHCPTIEVVLLGGTLRADAPDLMGPLTEANLERLHADVAFIGADGVDGVGRVYNTSMGVGHMLEKMAAAADRVFIVADSSKIGRAAVMQFGQAGQWDGLITDDALAADSAEGLRQGGVNLILASAACVAGKRISPEFRPVN